MDTKSATSTVIENGEISEGQREEQRKFNPSTFSFILMVPWDALQFLTEIFNLFPAVPEQKQSKPAEVLKIDIRFDKR